MARAPGAIGAALLLVCCNAIVGNEEVELRPSSGGSGGVGNTGGTVSGGGAAGTGATGGTGGTGAGANGGTGGVGAADAGDAADAPPTQVIDCGTGKTCPIGDSYCCVTGSGGSRNNNCWALSLSCTELKVECDSPDDCVTSTSVGICCADKDGSGTKPVHMKCQTSCTSSQWVVCGSKPTACATGSSCNQSTDYPAYNFCT